MIRASSFWPATVVVGCLLSACSSTPSAPKPSSYPALPSDAVQMKRLWQVTVGNGVEEDDSRLEPAIGEQRVVAASHNGVLLAVERETGKLLWKQRTGLSITAGPAAAYGSVVIGTDKGELAAFSEEDGHALWKVSVGAVTYTSPAVSSDTVIVLSSDGVIHALNRQDGSVRWTYNTSVPSLSLKGNAAPLLDESRVYVATSGGKLFGFDLASGVSGWDVRVATNNGRSELERMSDIVGNMLQSSDGIIYSVGYQSQLTATAPDNGRRRWQLDTSSVNDLAEGLGNVYVTDVSGNVIAVDQVSGKVSWKQTAYEWHTLTNPTVVDSLLAVGDDEGRVHLLAQSDGQLRGRIKVSGAAQMALAGRGDVLYAWSKSGALSAWQIRH